MGIKFSPERQADPLIGKHVVYLLSDGDAWRGFIRRRVRDDRYSVDTFGWISGRLTRRTLRFNSTIEFRLFGSPAEIDAWWIGWNDATRYEVSRRARTAR